MAKIKIAIISNPITDHISKNVVRLKNKLDAKQVDYEIEIILANQPAEKIANEICTKNYDFVMMDENTNAMDILDCCVKHPSKQKPRSIYIDGKIDAIIDAAFSQTNFSGAVGIFKGNDVILQKGYQASNRLSGHVVRNNSSTLFNIASMNKMMTGLAIAILVDELSKKLNIEDKESLYHKPIIDLLPPDYAHRHLFKDFTLHELLTHTSGLGRGGLREGDAFGASMARINRVEEFLPMFFPNVSSPETKTQTRGEHHYSNAGYCLLGLFIEATTGSYYDFIHKEILTPAGMNHTVSQRNSASSQFAIPYAGVPHYDLSKKPTCLTQLKQGSINPELKSIAQKAEELFLTAQSVQAEYPKIMNLIDSYQRGLSTTQNFSEFKEVFLKQLDIVHRLFFQEDGHGNFNYRYAQKQEEVKLLCEQLYDWLKENPQDETTTLIVNDLIQLLQRDGLFSYLSYPEEVITGFIVNLSPAHPAGCWYSSIEDFHAFQHALFDQDGVFSQYRDLTKGEVSDNPKNPNNGGKYGYGFSEYIEEGVRCVGHSGRAPGFGSNFSVYPDSGYTFITFANDSSSDMRVAYEAERFLARNSLPNSPVRVEFLDPRVSKSLTPIESMVEDITYLAKIKGKSAAISTMGINAQTAQKQEQQEDTAGEVPKKSN